MTKFKISGAGIDTTHVKTSEKIVTDYALTSISSNNDVILNLDTKTLITTVDHIDLIDSEVEGHLEILGYGVVDLLLIRCDPSLDWTNTESLRNLKDSGKVKNFGLICSSNTTVDELKKVLEESNVYFTYVALPISPLDFNLDLIKECRNLELSIIGLNPMGGYLSGPRNINAFTVPYLLGFCAYYSDIVLVSGRNLEEADDDLIYLGSLMGKETKSEYILNKSTSRLVKDIKKAVYPTVKVSEDLTVPFDDDQIVYGDISFNFKEVLNNTEIRKRTKIESDVNDYLGILKFSEDPYITAKYHVLSYLQETLGVYTEFSYIPFGKTTLLINTHKPFFSTGALWWRKFTPEENHYFILTVNESNNVPVFIEIEENSSEID